MAAKHVPDAASRYLVETAAAFCTQEQVALLLKVGVETLRKYYSEELERGSMQKLLEVGKNLYRIATEGEDKIAANVGMWFMERRGGDMWKPPDKRVTVDQTVKVAPPVIDSSKLTFEQRRQLRSLMQAALVDPGAPDVPMLTETVQ